MVISKSLSVLRSCNPSDLIVSTSLITSHLSSSLILSHLTSLLSHQSSQPSLHLNFAQLPLRLCAKSSCMVASMDCSAKETQPLLSALSFLVSSTYKSSTDLQLISPTSAAHAHSQINKFLKVHRCLFPLAKNTSFANHFRASFHG